uniref:F-box domain-containing protein n=1 Tax=Amphimedon queenslandica TaxID=400682 RepID=A0A1X7U8L1_AMPQE
MEPYCKRLKFDLSLFDDKSDGNFDDSESPIITISRSAAHQFLLLDDYEDEEYTNPFDSLPNEIIQEIFMILPLRDKMCLRLVNRRLYMICSDPYLWRNVVIDDAYHKTNAPFIKSALQTCRPHVQSLSLRGELLFSAYQRMIVSFDNIHTLNLYGFHISANALEKIYSALHYLQFLSLTFPYKFPSSSEKYFAIFAKLKKVVLVYNHSEQVRFFELWLLNNCLPPTFIIVSTYYKTYWSRRIHHLPNITHSAYFAAYRKFRRPLDFDFYDVPEYSLEIGPNRSESVAVTANGELMVTMRDMITPMNNDVRQRYAVFKDEAVTPGLSVYNSQYGVNITVLRFSSVTVSLESFRMIVKETPNVLEVNLRGSIISDCLDAYIVPLSVHCLKLRGLDVSRFSTSSRDNINFDVERFWNLLSKMKYLEYLSVKCCSFSPLTPNSEHDERSARVLTDRELAVKERVIGHIKRMTRLKGLHIFESITTEELDYFISQHLLSMISNLESLLYLEAYLLYSADIASLKSYNIEGLESILQKCQKLSILIIRCSLFKAIELPVDPVLYSNLTHLYIDCQCNPVNLAFGDALCINSKKKLKHLLLRRHARLAEDFLDKMIKESDFITFYEAEKKIFNRYDRNRSKNWGNMLLVDLRVAEFPSLHTMLC